MTSFGGEGIFEIGQYVTRGGGCVKKSAKSEDWFYGWLLN